MSNISYYGIKTLILFYLKIFFKEFYYNTIGTLISSIIFLIIIYTLTEYYNLKTLEIDYITFVIPGIIMMVIIQETFGNISGNIIWMKHHGTFQDLLVSPISRVEIAISMLFSIWIIGVLLSLIHLFVLNFFFEFNLFNFWRFIFYISATCIFFGCIGLIVGLLAYSWELQQSIYNFLIVPISLLSGTFFTIEAFNINVKYLLSFNPFYYLVSNTRKTFFNDQIYYLQTDLLIIFLVAVLFYITLYMFRKGYRVID